MDQSLFMPIILFIVGLGIIIKGGDMFVDAARWVSEVAGIPKLIVGATIISLATTLPELLVSSIATIDGNIGIAMGNAIGSVIANIGIGLSLGIIFIPATINPKEFNSKAIIMLVTTSVLLFFGISGEINIVHSVVLFIILAVYIYSNILSVKQSNEDDHDDTKPEVSGKIIFKNITMFVLGAAGIIIGADLLVDNGETLARAFGVSDAVIGLTIIAIGTSLPELVTAITSIIKKEGALSVGNILGANIIDMAMILPVCSIISGGTLAVESATVSVDIPVALFLMVVATVPTMLAKKFSRWQGFVILATYIGYLIYVVAFM